MNPYNPETKIFSAAREVFLEQAGKRLTHQLASSKSQGRQFLIKLSGIDGIDEARKCVGFKLCVAENALESLQPGEYYHYQTIGFEVIDLNGTLIGIITGILSTPAGELYVVQGTDKEHLIPALKQFIEKVDLAAGKMIIDPPTGLLDL